MDVCLLVWLNCLILIFILILCLYLDTSAAIKGLALNEQMCRNINLIFPSGKQCIFIEMLGMWDAQCSRCSVMLYIWL